MAAIEKIVSGLVLTAGATSQGYDIDLDDLGASGPFTLQIEGGASQTLTVTYNGRLAGSTPLTVYGSASISHTGGSKLYQLDLVPMSVMTLYFTSASGGTFTIHRGVW